MGFILQTNSNGISEILATQGGNSAEEFLAAVRECLAKKQMNIRVVVEGMESQLGAALPSLLKLQAVLKNHGKALEVVGFSQASADIFANKLKGAGITVDRTGTRNMLGVIRPGEAVGGVTTPGLSLMTTLVDLEKLYFQIRDSSNQLQSKKKIRDLLNSSLTGIGSPPEVKVAKKNESAALLSQKVRIEELKKECADLKQKYDQLEKAVTPELNKLKQELKAKETDFAKRKEQAEKDMRKSLVDLERRSKTRANEIQKLRSAIQKDAK